MNDAETASRTVTICNERGLHARAAAKFVKLAGQFAAEITVRKNGSEVSGRSIMGLMTIAGMPGCTSEEAAPAACSSCAPWARAPPRRSPRSPRWSPTASTRIAEPRRPPAWRRADGPSKVRRMNASLRIGPSERRPDGPA